MKNLKYIAIFLLCAASAFFIYSQTISTTPEYQQLVGTWAEDGDPEVLWTFTDDGKLYYGIPNSPGSEFLGNASITNTCGDEVLLDMANNLVWAQLRRM